MWTTTHGFLPKDVCWERAYLMRLCHAMDATVREHVDADFARYASSASDRLSQAAKSGNSKALYDEIKTITKRRTNSGPEAIFSVDGTVA